MSRPKKGVTLDNLLGVDRYFSRALQHDRIISMGWFKSYDAYYESKKAFYKISRDDWKNKKSLESRREALQNWIDKYIEPDKWQRCLLTLRQNKSHKKLRLRQLNLHSDTYLTVKMLAQKQDMTMGEAISKLAEPALERIMKAEFKEELKIKPTKAQSKKSVKKQSRKR